MSAPRHPEVVRELNELRKGRGLDTPELVVGPLLRAACSITESDRPDEVRSKLRLRLAGLCGRLPDDLRLAAEVALGLHPQAQGQFLEERKQWLATRFGRNPRTAHRRVAAAFLLLGECLDELAHDDQLANPHQGGWYVETLRAMLRLDLDPPVLTEERSIVATVDDLDEINLAFSVPRDPAVAAPPIDAQLIYGGELVRRQQVSASHASFVMRLPRPLSIGQRHEYSVQFTAVPRNALRPYYVLTPLTTCKHFYVRVRFGERDRPVEVWQLSGLPCRVIDDFSAKDEPKPVDSVGEVFLEFHELEEGRGYGLHWPTSKTEMESTT